MPVGTIRFSVYAKQLIDPHPPKWTAAKMFAALSLTITAILC